MSKIRRVIVAALATSALVVGGLGVGNAWARSGSNGSSGSRTATSQGSGSKDCPHDDDGGAGPSSSVTSLSL